MDSWTLELLKWSQSIYLCLAVCIFAVRTAGQRRLHGTSHPVKSYLNRLGRSIRARNDYATWQDIQYDALKSIFTSVIGLILRMQGENDSVLLLRCGTNRSHTGLTQTNPRNVRLSGLSIKSVLLNSFNGHQRCKGCRKFQTGHTSKLLTSWVCCPLCYCSAWYNQSYSCCVKVHVSANLISMGGVPGRNICCLINLRSQIMTRSFCVCSTEES